MLMRTPGRRPLEVKAAIRAGSFVAAFLVFGSLWFLYGRIQLLENPHNPHYGTSHCDDCHATAGKPDHSPKDIDHCFTCHDLRTRELKPSARGQLDARLGIGSACAHGLKHPMGEDRTVTSLCISCHRNVQGYVAMVDISSKKYVEIDMSVTHPIGLMPTETIYPKTLPLDRVTGAINCTTCHDPHAVDRRLKMLRYYYPGNGRPADFRPLCLDCHTDGWLPLKMRTDAVREAKRYE